MSASTKRPWARNTRDLQTKRKSTGFLFYQTPNLSISLSQKKVPNHHSCVVQEQQFKPISFFFRHSYVYTLERFVALRPTCNHSLNIHPILSFHFQGSQRREKIITDLCSLQKRHYSRPILKLENSLSSQHVEAWDRDPPLTTR